MIESIDFDGLISVIIPTYNRYELLIHAIKSVLDQTYQNFEIIVINDASTDKRYYNGILENFPKTRVIHLDINQREKYNKTFAQGIVRQYGMDIANGEWIAFLDDDDFYLQNKFEMQIKEMKRTNSLFCTTNTYIVRHNKISEDKLDIKIGCVYYDAYNLPEILTFSHISESNFINCSTVIIHRSIIKKTGRFKIIVAEDWDYWKRAIKYADCLYVSTPLTYITVNNKKYYK